MLKQTLIAGTALLLSAVPAFAFVSVDNSGAYVSVDSYTVANSGLNGVMTGEGDAENVNVTSGAAVASATVGTEVNNNTVNVTGFGCVSVDNSGANVEVSQLTLANTGLNGVVTGEGEAEGVTVTSGAATAASNTQTVVNVNNVTVSPSVE